VNFAVCVPNEKCLKWQKLLRSICNHWHNWPYYWHTNMIVTSYVYGICHLLADKITAKCLVV